MINPTEIDYKESIWQDIYIHFKNKGFDVYPPGIKLGECTSNYIVIKNDGSSRRTDTPVDDDYYSIMCYVPKQKYSDLEVYVQNTKRVMAELEPLLLPAGNQTPSFYDDSVKAHMVSIEYKNYKVMHNIASRKE